MEEQSGGYDFELAENERKDRYTCPICFLLLREVKLTPCSHSFCFSCLKKWEGENRSEEYQCPSCKSRYNKEKVHSGNEGKFVDRLVRDLKVHCKQKQCSWIGTIDKYEEAHEKNCDFKLLACINIGCSDQTVRKKFKEHLQHCPYRLSNCQHCGEKIVFRILENHWEICDYIKVKCQNQGCTVENIERRNLDEHVEKECQFTIISCSFKDLGCSHKMPRHLLTDHLKDANCDHTSLLLRQVVSLTTQLEKKHKKLEAAEKWIFAELNKLITDKRYDEFQSSISKNVDLVHLRDERKRTLLHIACEQNHVPLIDVLIKHVLKVADKDGNLPIHLAALNGHTKIVHSLLSYDSSPINQPGEKKQTLLHYGSSEGHVELVRYLLSVPKIDVHVQDVLGNLPIHLASLKGHTEIVRNLLSYDGNLINQAGEKKQTLLHYASGEGHVELVKYLLSVPSIDVYVQDSFGNQAIHLASLKRRTEIVHNLLSYDGNLINQPGEKKRTPLYYASGEGHVEVVKYLLSVPSIDVYVQDNFGNQAIHFASLNGNSEIVQRLLSYDANLINQPGKGKSTPLHYACLNGHVELVSYLLSCPLINVEAKNGNDKTPDQISTSTEIKKLLISFILSSV